MKFKVFYEDYAGDVPREIESNSAWGAAIEYAKYYDEASEHALVGDGNGIEVVVENEKKERQTFALSAQPSIDYWAQEK